jgi:hypothetical protein
LRLATCVEVHVTREGVIIYVGVLFVPVDILHGAKRFPFRYIFLLFVT